MRKHSVACLAALACVATWVAQPALAQNVKVTPLGSHDGEFCPQDRALVFEDPNGTRVLYDPGRTVAGANDPRLGKIDIVLVTHMHGDHATMRATPTSRRRTTATAASRRHPCRRCRTPAP
jgi:hypothetical protein